MQETGADIYVHVSDMYIFSIDPLTKLTLYTIHTPSRLLEPLRACPSRYCVCSKFYLNGLIANTWIQKDH